MAGPRIGDTRWSVAVSLLVAAAMTTIALVTVQQAGCEDPGHYENRPGGYELVGGCIEADDLPVAPEPELSPTAPAGDTRSPLRP